MSVQFGALQLETPALIIEEKIFNANAAVMSELLKNKTLKLRPHYKSHKCTAIAHMQIKAGAIGMTCAKLSEAEDLADSGIEDILIANQIVDPQKIRRAALLADRCRLTVCVDSVENSDALQKAASEVGSVIHCLIEYEIGMHRCGVETPSQVLDIAKNISVCSNLIYDGIQAYAGHLSHEISFEARKAETDKNTQKLRELIAFLKENGYEPKTLSGGSTGTSFIKAEQGLYTELQAGSYLFMDSTYGELKLPFKNSLFVLATVVSSRQGRIVLDTGVKGLGVDQGLPTVVGIDGSATVHEEHLIIENPSVSLPVGSKVRLIPGHCCSTVNLYDKIYMVDGTKVTDRIAVTARGKSI